MPNIFRQALSSLFSLTPEIGIWENGLVNLYFKADRAVFADTAAIILLKDKILAKMTANALQFVIATEE
jgi:hypothetical protein